MEFGAFAAFLALICAVDLVSSHPTEACSTNSDQYHMFGDRTLYEHVGGTLPSMSDRAPQGCEPIQIYMLVRHGARYPGASILPKLEKLKNISENVGQNHHHPTLCKKNLKAFRNWKIYTDQYDQLNQTVYGANEVKGVARRYKALFPELLAPSVPVDKFQFFSTNRPQTRASLTSFVEEILKNPDDEEGSQTRIDEASIEVPSKETDQFYANTCKNYLPYIRHTSAYTPRYTAFGQGPLIQTICDNIARRLAIPRSSVNYAVLWSMYNDGCRYEQQVDASNGPWCKLFTKEELKVLQFWRDLKDYEYKGPSLPLAQEKNCVAAKDVISLMTSTRDEDRRGGELPAAKFRSLHTSNIATLAVYFRLLGDIKPLTEHNYATMKNRKFDFSKMIPTGGHMAFVLYRCSNDDYKMQVFWNERVVAIPGCPESSTSLCSLDRILEIYPEFVAGSTNECNQIQICGEY